MGRLLRHGTAVSGGVSGALITPFKQAMAARPVRARTRRLSRYGAALDGRLRLRPVPLGIRQGIPGPGLRRLHGLFTDNPDAKRLLTYLASRQAQALWVRHARGDAFSADQAVLRRRDVMSPDVSTAFSQAVLEYVNNRDSLDELLRGLQRTQQRAGPSPVWNLACSGRS